MVLPPPDGLTLQAWRLFAVFAAAIVSVVVNALPILTASVLAVAASVLTGLLPPAKAYAGFANGTILLIVLAFLVARAVVKCGLGTRVGYAVVSVFGRSTLGLVLQHLPRGRRSSRRRSRATPRAPACSIRWRSRSPKPAGATAGRRELPARRRPS